MNRRALCWTLPILALLTACEDPPANAPAPPPADPVSEAPAEPAPAAAPEAAAQADPTEAPTEVAAPADDAPTEPTSGFELGDGGGATNPTRALRAWFDEHGGCDPQCAVADPEAEPSAFYLREPTRLASTTLADGFAQVWHVQWFTDGAASGSDLILVVPDGGTGDLENAPSDRDEVYGLSDLLPVVVAGHRVMLAAELGYNEQQGGNDLLVDRSTIRRPHAPRVENGVLRTSFVMRHTETYLVGHDECGESERGPTLHYHRAIFCSRTDDPISSPDDCPTCIDAGPGLLCRNLISRRGLSSPGGAEDCNGPIGTPRRASRDERRPLGVEIVATSPSQLSVEATRGDVPETLLGAHPLARWSGLPRFERLCPVPSLREEDCDDEQLARYRAEVGLPAE